MSGNYINQQPQPATTATPAEQPQPQPATPAPPAEQPQPATTAPPAEQPQAGGLGDDQKWGTKYMAPPAAPSSHPSNQQAAVWGAQSEHHPYILHSTPDEKQSGGGSPMETILGFFNEWSRKAESLANNVWQNLKTGSSVTDAAWGKLSLTAKAISEGGFESLYKHTFPVDPNETLRKTFACYLSTSSGPVAGTLYLSNLNVAFCSDRPLAFTAPSGQQAWSYYKVAIPLAKVAAVSPVTIKENPPEKYIQITTVDGHEFWFMGFVNYDKASTHLLEAVSSTTPAAHQPTPAAHQPPAEAASAAHVAG